MRYTPAALAHLNEIGDYIAKDNPEAARRVIRAIRQAVDLLSDNPEMGRRGHLDGTREIVIPRLPYYAAYRRDHDRHRGIRRDSYRQAGPEKTA